MEIDQGWNVAAGFLFILLPIVSAISSKNRNLPFVSRYSRCLVCYVIIFVLIYAGYLVQGIIEKAIQERTFDSGLKGIIFAFESYDYGYVVGTICVVSSITTLAMLLGRNNNDVAVNGFRAAFLCFTVADILWNMMIDAPVGKYVMCVVFNFGGAMILGAVGAVIICRIRPDIPEPSPDVLTAEKAVPL